MRIDIVFTLDPIVPPTAPTGDTDGAAFEFTGIVRGLENGVRIGGLRYEIYRSMAERTLREIAEEIAREHAVSSLFFIHREGPVRVGESAVYARVSAAHRAPCIRFMETLLDRLKQDIPIWKAGVIA